jgi:hypothetical protein
MNNHDLDRRIATEFMGWELSHNSEIWCQDGECLRDVEDFSPTTDMNAAYIVLEKIASVVHVTISNSSYGGVPWVVSAELYDQYYTTYTDATTLPLAISKLAEKIMDTPEYMALFRGE